MVEVLTWRKPPSQRLGSGDGTGAAKAAFECPTPARTFHERRSAMSSETPTETNPKLDDQARTNQRKDPEQWVSGDDPMTGAQASYLKTLSEQAHEPDAFAEDLSKAEASERIDRLRDRLGLGDA
jgi:hypothetical protein